MWVIGPRDDTNDTNNKASVGERVNARTERKNENIIILLFYPTT